MQVLSTLQGRASTTRGGLSHRLLGIPVCSHHSPYSTPQSTSCSPLLIDYTYDVTPLKEESYEEWDA